MNLAELHQKLGDILHDVDHYPGGVEVLVGGAEFFDTFDSPENELLAVDRVDLVIKDQDENEINWNFEDGSPVLGVHYDKDDQLKVIVWLTGRT